VIRAYGMPLVEIVQPIDKAVDLEYVESKLSEIPNIGYVYMTHHETGTGLLNPIREVGALAHKYGAFFITDTTSSYAMIPIDVKRDNIDFCMASAQKGIMGMTGLSYVIGRRDIIAKSKDFPTRSYYCNLFLQYDYFEKTGEMHFTPPVQTIYAAKQALVEYFEEGEENKWARHLRVMKAIHDGEDRLGLQEALSRDVQSGLVSAIKYPDDPNWDFDKVHDYCYERGFTIYPGKIESKGTFRLCALGAIDSGDIEDFWVVFEEAMKANNIAVPAVYN
ncbi:MAG: aminotransferase class V-fold PLP-dependent enzyme, partial [Clostridiales bacterium]|nr:aminotransferase class V-fold PLP-dependent enzyme [Clostridiales bacterium]